MQSGAPRSCEGDDAASLGGGSGAGTGSQESETQGAPPCGDKAAADSGNGASPDSVREEGLKAFRNGDWQAASEAWSRGLRTLDYILAKQEEFDPSKKQEFEAMQQSYLLNLSLSTLKEGRWATCISYCDRVLEHNPTALKALYRKAQAQQELGMFDAALSTVQRYLEAAPNSPLAVSLQQQLRHQKAAHAVRERKVVRGMFSRLEHDPRSDAAASSSAETAESSKVGFVQSAVGKVKNLFRSGQQRETEKSNTPVAPFSDKFAAQSSAQNNGENWPFGVGSGPLGNADSTDAQSHAALVQALSAVQAEGCLGSLFGGPDGPSQVELEQLAALVQMHQRLSSDSATLFDKLRFGCRLFWFGVKRFCRSIGSRLCSHRRRGGPSPSDEQRKRQQMMVNGAENMSEKQSGSTRPRSCGAAEACKQRRSGKRRVGPHDVGSASSKVEDLGEFSPVE